VFSLSVNFFKRSNLKDFDFIFNCIINNINFFRWGRFAKKKEQGNFTPSKSAEIR
jgi:hypothetical protein